MEKGYSESERVPNNFVSKLAILKRSTVMGVLISLQNWRRGEGGGERGERTGNGVNV